MSSLRSRFLFVTGRLAEPALRSVVHDLAERIPFDYEIAVLGISVAALMNTLWVSRRLRVDSKFDRIILPGWCQGDLGPLSSQYEVPVERGPKDLFDLPTYFGEKKRRRENFGGYQIEIIAEINHASRISLEELLRQAGELRGSGADLIDLGCVPGETWSEIGSAVRALRETGARVSVDSFDRSEVEAAVEAGAELVLSCHRGNAEWASQLPVEFVVIPERPEDWGSLEEGVEILSSRACKFRIDPILEPIGHGFFASLERYARARKQWPELPIMMGVGNLTELTECDSAAVNLLMACICSELGIKSILTTQVIPWCQTAVQEFDLARRLADYCITNRAIPKHIDAGLVMLRDGQVRGLGQELLKQLAAEIKDPNYRIFAEGGEIHIMNRDGYWHGTNPFQLFAKLPPLEQSHAFYLGYEMSKAMTALTLGKQYRQDQSLNWGFLTREEPSPVDRHAPSQDRSE